MDQRPRRGLKTALTLYLTSPSDHSVKRLRGATVETVIADRRLQWPDTSSEGADGRLYVTTSHIPSLRWFNQAAPVSLRTELYSFAPVPD